jgi:hypothetical protein
VVRFRQQACGCHGWEGLLYSGKFIGTETADSTGKVHAGILEALGFKVPKPRGAGFIIAGTAQQRPAMGGKVTWIDLWKMTDAEQRAFKAKYRARFEAGEMTPDEIRAIGEEWAKLAAHEMATADLDFDMIRLARATGCPDDAPVIPWLLERGLVARIRVQELDRFRLTAKGEEMLRSVGPNKRGAP